MAVCVCVCVCRSVVTSVGSWLGGRADNNGRFNRWVGRSVRRLLRLKSRARPHTSLPSAQAQPDRTMSHTRRLSSSRCPRPQRTPCLNHHFVHATLCPPSPGAGRSAAAGVEQDVRSGGAPHHTHRSWRLPQPDRGSAHQDCGAVREHRITHIAELSQLATATA